MADLEREFDEQFVDRRRTQASGAEVLATVGNYSNITALKARLTAISATSYTPDRLATMTKNDMVYAVRLNDDAAGI